MTKHIAVQPAGTPIESESAPLLPLDAPRSIAFKTAKHSFVYRFRRIGLADWTQYFQAIVNQVIQIKEQRENIFETESALLELVDRTVIGVEGYGETMPKDWKKALPLHHRIAAGIALRSVSPAKMDPDGPMLCDLVTVNLDANWSAGDDGKTNVYSGLIHRFRQPGIADLKRFNFEAARVRVTGTADNGVTVYPSRQAIAKDLRRHLIESVEGYSVAGVALAGVEPIKHEMDGAHKAAAALALFVQDDEITIQ